MQNISKTINASIGLRSKKELIKGFIAQITVKTDVDKDWATFIKTQKEQNLEVIINEEKLKPDESQKFIDNAFQDADIKTGGTDINKILHFYSCFDDALRSSFQVY